MRQCCIENPGEGFTDTASIANYHIMKCQGWEGSIRTYQYSHQLVRGAGDDE